jgi:O-antigen/teichoic acid export membrane protein
MAGFAYESLVRSFVSAAVGMPDSNALESIERPHEVFWAGLFAVVLTAALVWWFVPGWGLLGAAYGFLAGNVVGATGLWVAFLASVQRHLPEAHPKTHPGADPMTMGLDSISTPVTGRSPVA